MPQAEADSRPVGGGSAHAVQDRRYFRMPDSNLSLGVDLPIPAKV